MKDKSKPAQTQQQKSDSRLQNDGDFTETNGKGMENADLVTSIQHYTKRIQKTHRRLTDGSIKSENYSGAKTFASCVERPVETFEDLVKAIRVDENNVHSAIVRARYNTEDLGPVRHAHRFHRRMGEGSVFHQGPQMHRWQVFDVDELLIPRELNGDHKAILRYAIAQLPEELQGADFYYQWSASMCVKPGVAKLHLYTLLDTFVSDDAMRIWVQNYNESYRSKYADRLTSPTENIIDPALWSPNQPLTTSPPCFIGMKDPLKSQGIPRSGVIRGDKGSVDIAAVVKEAAEKRAEFEREKERQCDAARRAREASYSEDYTAQENYQWACKVRDTALNNIRMMNGAKRTDIICVAAKTIGGLVGAGYLHRGELQTLIDTVRQTWPKDANNSKSQAESYFKIGEREPFEREAKTVQRWFAPKRHTKSTRKPLPSPDARHTPAPTTPAPQQSAYNPHPVDLVQDPLALPPIEGANTPVENETAESVVEEMDLVDVFQRNIDDAKRALHGFGRFTLANECGTGKNTGITTVIAEDINLLDGLIIAEPTCAKRDEMAREMRAAGIPIREAVTRTSKNCRRIDDLQIAGNKSPDGAQRMCHACEFNPKGPNYTGEQCPYMLEKNKGSGAQVVTHAQLPALLEEDKPSTLIIDEAVSNEHGHARINLEQILNAWNAGDVEMTPDLFNMLRVLINESKKPSPRTGRHDTMYGLEICERLLHLKDDRPKVSGTWNAASDAIDELLDNGVPKSHEILAKLCEIPNWRAILGLKHVQERGWAGVNIHNGQISLPWVNLFDVEGIASVIRTDATCTEALHLAFGGTPGEWHRVNVKAPEHFHMIRVNEGMSKSSGKDGQFSERKLKIWDAAHFSNDGPETLHIVHKAYFDIEHPMYDRIKRLQGPVIYYGGDEARGSNKYKHVTNVVADSWHVPKRAIIELAYRLEYIAELNGMDAKEREATDWEQQAMFQMLPAEIIQTVHRARLVQASEERPVTVTLLDDRPLEDCSPLFKDCIVQRPCVYTYEKTGEIIHGGRFIAETLLCGLIEANNGVACPTLFFENPDASQRVDDSEALQDTTNPSKDSNTEDTLSALNTSKDGGFNAGSYSSSAGDAKRWKTSENASIGGSVEWDEESKKGGENRRGQPNGFSPYIDLGGFSIRLTQADYDGIRRAMGNSWVSEYGLWTKSSLSSGRGQYALLHTRDITRDDIICVVKSAGKGWGVATCQGMRVRMDDWKDRVIAAAKTLPHSLQTAPRTVFAQHLAEAMGESVATLKRNTKAVQVSLAELHALVPDPPPEPPKPPKRKRRTWKRPDMTAPHVERVNDASQGWDIAALRRKAMEFRKNLHKSQGEARMVAADELWTAVFIGKLSSGVEIFTAQDEADTFVRRELGRLRVAA